MKHCCLSVSAMQEQCQHACPAQMQHGRMSSCSMPCIINTVEYVCISMDCSFFVVKDDYMPLQKLEDEVARLQAVNSELLKDKEEALPLLEAYRSAHNWFWSLTTILPCVALCHVRKYSGYINKGIRSSRSCIC